MSASIYDRPIGLGERLLDARQKASEARRRVRAARARYEKSPRHDTEALLKISERQAAEAADLEGKILAAMEASPETEWPLYGTSCSIVKVQGVGRRA